MANLESVKTAISKRSELESPTTVIERMLKKNVAGLGKALPSHMKAERLERIVLTLLRMSPKLAECEPISIIAAVFTMAQLGLEPIDGQAYIIPYKGKAQFQIGYKGLVTLFYRHPLAKALNWGVVRENDTFVWDRGQGVLRHQENLRGERGDVYAYWIKAELTTGGTIVECMSKEAVEKHAKDHSKTFGSGPWQTDFDSMALKTVFIKASKLMPKAIELQKALELDTTIKSKVAVDMAEVPDETDWKDKTLDVKTDMEKAAAYLNGKPDETGATQALPPVSQTKCGPNGEALDKTTGRPI